MNNADPHQQRSQGLDLSRFSDSESDVDDLRDRDRATLPPAAKSPSDILTSFSRGFAKLKRQPSQLVLKHNREQSVATPEPTSNSIVSVSVATPGAPANKSPSAPGHQHVRSLSFQNSLSKPLPEPPPPSPRTPVAAQQQHPPAPSHQQHNSVSTVLDTSVVADPPLDLASDLSSDLPSDSEKDSSRTSTMDSATSELLQSQMGSSNYTTSSGSNGQVSLSGSRQDGDDGQNESLTPKSAGPTSQNPSPQAGQSRTPGMGNASGGPSPASGLLCNVHRTTGREPHPLVGATTTIVGDKLYVFGGRILSRSRPTPLTSDLYELDLIRRHWTKLETSGDIPPPRYFHSMCALGDTKMVCYGGMSPAQTSGAADGQGDVTVMSDIYIYDVTTRKWTFIPVQEAPQGRYAHCACILPSSATFSSHKAPLSALQHNPATGANEGRIGINIDGTGGSEMVVVGGQDGANHYIEQISVFNLRSLKWTSTQALGKSCGAYRSVVAPLPPVVTAKIGKANTNGGAPRPEGGISQEAREPGSSMLIYSNYNFLDVKLELQIRASDGTLSEKQMSNAYSPPGLRFPNGGVIDTYFVVSGTYLTSSKQEYALWALDLRTLQWMRIDAGGSVFRDGSWNRGVLWNRRNTFVILGHRKRSLVDDYNHRRINFTNVCMVELEAFGFYDNPRKVSPLSGFISASSPYNVPGLSLARKAGATAGGRFHSRASEELGEKALAIRELADMDILCIGGERIPINSRIVGRRWGPYFVQLLREGTAMQDGSDAMTLRSLGGPGPGGARSSMVTITPATRTTTRESDGMSTATTLAGSSGGSFSAQGGSTGPAAAGASSQEQNNANAAPTPRTLAPNSRPRCLYLPHTYLTVQALLHFLYTSSLPAPSSPLCTPQILCSLLQIARPYRIDGLLEAIVERLHTLFENRNAAAIFNATAMAAGGGRGIDGSLNPNYFILGNLEGANDAASQGQNGASDESNANGGGGGSSSRSMSLRINTAVPGQPGRPASGELSATASASGSDWSVSEVGDSERGAQREIWSAELSSVIGLQKRGLRGLMEGRKLRERTGAAPPSRVGLGIASGGS